MVKQTVTTKRTSWTYRTWLAFVLGKLCIALLQLTHWLRLPWGGTAFPGRVALKVDRHILAALRGRYRGLILVTGTNGKTSTTALLVKLLQSTGLNVVSNPEGANMVPGLLTALLKAEPWGAFNDRTRLAVLEVDEGSLLPLSKLLTDVNMIVVTNLFPDQLDRYGSVAALARRMKQAIATWPDTTLLLNADDPQVASFGQDRTRTHYFTMYAADDDPADANLESGEIALCPVCKQELKFSTRHYAHLGKYTCLACGFNRPKQFIVTGFPLPPKKEETGCRFVIRAASGQKSEFDSTLTGLYNGYNIIAAVATTLIWQPKTELTSLAPVVAAFRAPAGRTEYFFWPIQEKKATLVLVKNPTGFNQALAALAETTTGLTAATLVVAINDLPADGRDISWLWDTYISAIPNHVSIICSGRRAADVAVCFKYHGVPLDKLTVAPEPDQAVQLALANSASNIILLCNYTILASLRQALIKRGGTTDAA